MRRILFDIQKPQSTPRVRCFRKKAPERTLLFVGPPATVFSSWTKHLGFFVAFFLGPAIAFSVSTNAAFSDSDHFSSQGIGTGEWVPDIRLEERGDCMKLSSSLPEAKIYYTFVDDGDPRTSGVVFDGECIKTPKGKKKAILLRAQAFHPTYDQWKSDILEKSFSRKKDRDHHENDGRNTGKGDGKKEDNDFVEEKRVSGANESEYEYTGESTATIDLDISDELLEEVPGVIIGPIIENTDKDANPFAESDTVHVEKFSSSEETL